MRWVPPDGRRIAALGAVPLAAGVVVPVAPVLGGPALCPLRALTGVPCPLCGATRAFVLAGHGDGRWLHYGAVWVVLAVLALVAGLALMARGRPVPRPRRAWPGVVAAAALAWAWALAHAGTITA